MLDISALHDLTQVEIDRIARVQVDLQHLRENGVLAQVNCYRLGGVDRLTTNAERGIEDTDPRAKRMSPGRIKTIPPVHANALITIREAARSKLDGMSHDVTGFRPWRYIPVDAFATWLKEQTAYEARFEAIKKQCIQDLDAFVFEELERVQNLAARNWKAIWANAEKHGRKYDVTVDGHTYTAKQFDLFSDRMWEYTVAKIPHAVTIEEKIQLTWSVGGIETASSVIQELAAAQEAQTRLSQARAEDLEARVEAYRSETELHKAEEEEKAELTAMRAIVAERIRAQLMRLPDPGVEIIEQLRTSTGEAIGKAKVSLDGKKRLYKGSSVAITNAISRFEMLDHGDTELEALMAELKARMTAGAGNYEYSEISQTLGDIERLCAQKVTSQAQQAAAMLEVSVLPGAKRALPPCKGTTIIERG